jgi:hypothetical protein
MKMCLDENKIAHCVEWLAEYEGVEISDALKSHLGNCLNCAMEVLEVWEIFRLIIQKPSLFNYNER